MNKIGRVIILSGCVLIGLGLAWACAYDDSLRQYLDAHFWQPFSKHPRHFERKDVQRVSVPFAGMDSAAGASPLAKLRTAYQTIPQPVSASFDVSTFQPAIAAAKADPSLTPKQCEEVDLIDAKIDMRSAQVEQPELLRGALKKFEVFLRTARSPEFISEARGWMAHIHYVLRDQTAAGKIYLDELNRNGSNLSRETLLNSLRMNYGYDGGQELVDHLVEYFDTPEHAAFAIQIVTNPHWDRNRESPSRAFQSDLRDPQLNSRIESLLQKHADLLSTNTGANALALLAMRTELNLGDPAEALKIATKVPANATIRSDPDFQWMLASVYFLSREYAAAERPLLELFRSPRSSENQRAASAYALCGVYQKRKNAVEQIRFALWLHTAYRKKYMQVSYPSEIADMSVYWAVSGWDLSLLLDAEAPIDALETFINQNPDVSDLLLVQYSLAVRLARENRYGEAARIFESINANLHAARMQRLAALYEESNRAGLSDQHRQEAKFNLAEFISAHPNGIYYNDTAWLGFQRYALIGSTDSRFTRSERQKQMDLERKLKDEQEERWRAYLILRDVVRDAGNTELGRKAAALGVKCLRGISERFGRAEEIRKADIALSRRLR
jgi:tetratricopeptide (TPR) repeat protein